MAESEIPSLSEGRSGRPYIVATTILVVLMGFLALFQNVEGGSKAYIIGQAFGVVIFMALVTAVIYRVARFATKTKPRATSAKITFWISLVWFLLMLGTTVATITNPRLVSRAAITEKQRQALQVGADSIRNDSLGFVLPHPGADFLRSEKAESTLTKNAGLKPNMVLWFFRDPLHQRGLTIQVTTFLRLSETSFRSFARGLRNSVPASAIVSDTLSWTGKKSEYVLVLR